MIHVEHYKAEPEKNLAEALTLTITDTSLDNFKRLVDRALNCWDDAPKELKDLGDMLTHGRITQDYTPPKKMQRTADGQ